MDGIRYIYLHPTSIDSFFPCLIDNTQWAPENISRDIKVIYT